MALPATGGAILFQKGPAKGGPGIFQQGLVQRPPAVRAIELLDIIVKVYYC